MATNNPRPDPRAGLDALPPTVALSSVLLMLAAVAAGTLGAVVALPALLPGLAGSLAGSEPRAFWYLSRASGLVSFGLLWLAMALGLAITNKLARAWPGGPTAFDLHQHVSVLGLGFGLFHGLILLGDKYTSYTLAQVLVPFAGASYRPVWVGLGQVAFYLLALVGLSSYARRQIGPRLWRLIHSLSFVVFLLALAHGLAAGTDSGAPVVSALYWASGGSLLSLTVYRVVTARAKPARPAAAARPARPAAGPARLEPVARPGRPER